MFGETPTSVLAFHRPCPRLLWLSRCIHLCQHSLLGIILKEYFVVDAELDRVMIVVTHGVKSAHLYVSDTSGLKYTLSLPNIVYVSPTSVGLADRYGLHSSV